MSCETAFAGVDYLVKQLPEGTKGTVTLFGGEPLLRWQVIEPLILYAEKMYPNKLNFTITTNCVLLDEAKSKFLIDHKVGVLTSFDGAKETQDYNRPFHNDEGSYDHVYANIMAHKARGGKLGTMRATVYPDTAHLMFENYMQAINMGYSSTFFMTDSFSTFDEAATQGYRDAMFKIADHYIEYWKQNGKEPIQINNIRRCYPQAYEDIIRAEAGLDIPTKPHSQRCGYGQNSLAALSPRGDFFSCQQMTSNEGSDSIWWIGNLKTGIQNSRRQALLNHFNSEGPRKGDMDCSQCSGRSICKGGCVATNYLIYEQMRQNSPTWCMNMRVTYETARYIVEQLRDDEAFLKYINEISKREPSVCAKCQETQNEG